MDKPTYTVIRDTREKEGYGWTFSSTTSCLGTKRGTLKTGDYTIEGYEDILAIDRKGGIEEVAINVLEARFEKEMERMDSFKYAFILLEFDMQAVIDFPNNTRIPYARRKTLKYNGYFILRKLMEIQLKHKVKIIFCGDHGKSVAASIFKLVTENEQKQSIRPEPVQN